MPKDIVVEADAREVTGRSNVRRLRNDGRLPGVIYGKDVSRKLTVDRLGLLKILHAHGAHPLVTVKVDGDEYLALVKELQVDPVRQLALHVDFYRVEEDKPVRSEVRLEVLGTPEGVKEGGVLEVLVRTLDIEALPRALPELIELDVSHLEIGDVARIGDIIPPEGVTILHEAEEAVATVAVPSEVVEEEEVELTEEELEALAELTPEELEELEEAAEELEELAAEEEPEEGAPEGEAPAEDVEDEEG